MFRAHMRVLPCKEIGDGWELEQREVVPKTDACVARILLFKNNTPVVVVRRGNTATVLGTVRYATHLTSSACLHNIRLIYRPLCSYVMTKITIRCQILYIFEYDHT